MRWRRVESTDVVDQRAGGGFPGGGRVAIPGGLGVTGILIYLAISLLSGGGSSYAVDDPFGTSGQVEREQRDNPDQRNALSVRLELQADCDTFSGNV